MVEFRKYSKKKKRNVENGRVPVDEIVGVEFGKGLG